MRKPRKRGVGAQENQRFTQNLQKSHKKIVEINKARCYSRHNKQRKGGM